MPSKTKKQERFMQAVANNPKFAKEVGVPQSVGKEFEMKDAKMARGGVTKMARGGSVDGCAIKGKTKGTVVTMARGGDVKMARGGKTKMARGGRTMMSRDDEVMMARGGKTMMARGGGVKKRC